MTYKYLHTDEPREFTLHNERQKVLLNPDKLRFNLIADPSHEEISVELERYADIRREEHWKWLMAETPAGTRGARYKPTCIRLFHFDGVKARNLHLGPLLRLFNVRTAEDIQNAVKTLSFDEQRDLAATIKPRNTAEFVALCNIARLDQIGYLFLKESLEQAVSAVDFYGKLLDQLFAPLSGANYRVGTAPPMPMYQARILEFLGCSSFRQWLLFPFIHTGSAYDEHYILAHRSNVQYYFDEAYWENSLSSLFHDVKSIPAAKTTHVGFAIYLRNLITASTYRTIGQSSTALFNFCLVNMDTNEVSVRYAGMARRLYNILLKTYNSTVGINAPLPPCGLPKKSITLDDYSSFEEQREQYPRLTEWSGAFGQFVASSTDSQGQARKLACIEFITFLAGLKDAPSKPEEIERKHINDFREGSSTYRNYLVAADMSNDTRTIRLQFLAQFFDYWFEQLRAQIPAHASLRNPVDLKFDRFSTQFRAGTHRKAIGSRIMEEMRNILVEDDYKWPKSIAAQDWVHLADRDSGKIEYVWCPSATILLYLLLTIPLRTIQARLLDSGEGDPYIYDFESKTMVPNTKQLPVGDKVDHDRREGLLQIVPSGMLGVTDFIGLWVTTNKTSDDGYTVPWVSEDLLRHIKYQRDWIFRYSNHPNMHGIIAAQGYAASKPKEWQEKESKFYCLFRDPSAERVPDASLPVSKQKLLKFWGLLCAETEKRLNQSARDDSERVRLAGPPSPGRSYPTALFDLHTLRVSGITDLLDRGVPLNIVSEYVAGHATYVMTLWYDRPAPGKIREALQRAHDQLGDSTGPIPRFDQEELQHQRQFLISHPDFSGQYTGFDALDQNSGLVTFRQSGICPGARCEEGGLDDRGRAIPVPVGDRGPSCPQCRFWLTGPAFLLGQVVEGNQLILKIRNKVHGLVALRENVLTFEDQGNTRAADVARGQVDVEERQLNDMLTEWWHRIRFYSASIEKLGAYRAFKRDSEGQVSGDATVVLLTHATEEEMSFAFSKSTDIELKHFLSTCAEILPEFIDVEVGAKQDIEIAIGKFLALNKRGDLTGLFFQLNNEERLKAGNLMLELMLHAAMPHGTQELLDGKASLQTMPELEEGLGRILALSSEKSFKLTLKEVLPIGVGNEK